MQTSPIQSNLVVCQTPTDGGVGPFSHSPTDGGVGPFSQSPTDGGVGPF